MHTATHNATVTGLPALLIILAILAVIVTGLFAIIKFIAQKSKNATSETHREE